MRIDRVWAMPNKRTFQIKPIKQLLERYSQGVILDLFPYPFQGDALEYIKIQNDFMFDTVLFDPPYSFHQQNATYDGLGNKITDTYRKDVKDHIRRVLRPNGVCISFGWNTNGMGKERGFEIEYIMLVAHGGGHNDTLVTVERKVQETLA